MRTLQLLALAMLLPGVSIGPAQAQQGVMPSPDQVIAFLDKDGDGKVSFNEYMAFQQAKLARFDADGDGELSFREFKSSLDARAQKNAERSFEAFNTRSRNMSEKEFLTYHAYVFNTFVDTDRDGFLSAGEWEKITQGAR